MTKFLSKKLIITLTLIFISIRFFDLYSQHLYYLNYNDLSQENAKYLKTQIANLDVLPLSMKRSNDNKDVYPIEISSIQNTKIIIFNEKNGNNAVITPVEDSLTQFQLEPFLIEELKQSVLGDAERYLVFETCSDFSVRNVLFISNSRENLFLPRYFYGKKGKQQEALPQNRQIVHIFKEKPRYFPAFPDDPENLRYIAQLEEEMSYYVYMYRLPDSTLCIYDHHFNKEENEKEIKRGSNLQFNLTGNMSTQAQTATLYALDIWSDQLGGTVPVDINVDHINMGGGVIGGSYQQPNYWNAANQTWYCSALGNQLAGYNVVPTQYDIRLIMNTQINFYFGSTGNPIGNQIDWITVMLHEITHGLGFFTLCGSNGAYSYTASNGWNYGTVFPGIFDRQLFQGTTGDCLTELTQSQRQSLIVSDNLYAGAPSSFLLEANGGTRVKMYAPNPWQPGSSVSHWDWDVTFATFMKYAIIYGFKLHAIGTRKIAIMIDMGWTQPSHGPYTVSVSANPPEGGIVSEDGEYEEGESVTVTATPNQDYSFANWTENGYIVSTNVNYTFNIFSNRNLVANFCTAISSFPYNEDFEENGDNFPDCWSQEFVSGTVEWEVVSAATGTPSTANSGAYKARMQNNSNTSQKTKLVMPSLNLSEINNPELKFWHTQRTWSGDQDKLRIFYKVSSGDEWNLLQEYTTNVNNWTERNIALPSPTADYYIAFEGETLYGHGIQLDDISITEVVNLSLLADPIEGGNPTQSGSGNYQQGESVTVNANSNAGYNFLDWKENGNIVSSNVYYTFNINENIILTAYYTQNQYTVTFNTPQYGMLSVMHDNTPIASGTSVNYGAVLKIMATPDENYHLETLTVNDDEFTNGENCKVTEETNIVCSFEEDPKYNLTLNVNPTGAGTTTGEGNYYAGESVTISANPNENYHFVNWTENDIEVSQYAEYTVYITENRNLVANFEFDDGININSLVEVLLFPNPFKNEINISNPAVIKNIEIYDAMGIIQNFAFRNSKIQNPKFKIVIDTSNFSVGVYFVAIEGITGEKAVYKMVKK